MLIHRVQFDSAEAFVGEAVNPLVRVGRLGVHRRKHNDALRSDRPTPVENARGLSGLGRNGAEAGNVDFGCIHRPQQTVHRSVTDGRPVGGCFQRRDRARGQVVGERVGVNVDDGRHDDREYTPSATVEESGGFVYHAALEQLRPDVQAKCGRRKEHDHGR